MARGSDQATSAATSAQNLSNTYSGNAGSLFAPLSSSLLSEAAHPSGIDPTTMARMDTASQEAAGGGSAGAQTSGTLRALRTRNAGGSDAAIAQGARTSGETATKGVLGSRLKSAEMQESQRRSALAGLGGLYGENVSGGNQALGIIPGAVNANTQAAGESWDWAKYLLDPAMAGAGQGAGLAACWIAEAIYGVDDPRTHAVRAYLNGPFRQSLAGDLTMRLYLAVGQRVARLVRRSGILRAALKPVFDIALRKALA